MGTLNHFPLTFSLPLRPFLSSSRSHASNPIFLPHTSPNALASKRFRNKIVVGSNSSGPNESQFLDENGVVDDMDGYLNYLSLEYDSVWDTKPSWGCRTLLGNGKSHCLCLIYIVAFISLTPFVSRCQPWTILLTGVSAIALSWLILRSVVVTTLVSVLTCTWWYIFLYSYPKAYAEMIAERRRKVTNGVEDTFGLEKSQ